MFSEFRNFISLGNVMDMGAGNIIGGAFTAIVKTMVSDILNPILGIFLGGVNFSSLAVSVGDAVFSY